MTENFLADLRKAQRQLVDALEAVEALRKNDATYLQEVEHFRERALDAEARVVELGKDYGQAVDKFDECRAALARRVEQDTGKLPHPPDSNTQEWREWLIGRSDKGAEATEARVAELELAALVKNARHGKALGDRVLTAEARVVELEGELKHEQGKLWDSAGRNNALQKRAEAAEARVVELTEALKTLGMYALNIVRGISDALDKEEKDASRDKAPV